MRDRKDIIEPINAAFDDVAAALVGATVGVGAEVKLPIALYSGTLPIGGIELDCAVLEDGTRVLSERAVHRAFGSKRGEIGRAHV